MRAPPLVLALAAACGPSSSEPEGIAGRPQPIVVDVRAHAIGQLTSTGDGRARRFYQHDALGRVVAAQHVLDNRTFLERTRYGYPTPAAGPGSVVESRIDDEDERVSYRYDAGSRLAAITTTPSGQPAQAIVTFLGRDLEGKPTSFVHGNGVTTEMSYDPETQRLARAEVRSGTTPLARAGYLYDDNGNVEQVSDEVRPDLDAWFSYDAWDQLVTMSGTFGERAWEYDRVGNLTRKEGVDQTYGAGGRPHAIATAGAVSFGYDAAGNRVSDSSGTTIVWDAEGRPRQIRDAAGAITENRYVSRGRWKKVEGGVTTYYLPNARVENGAYRKLYDGHAERTPAGELRWFHRDQLGSTSLITDESGAPTARLVYWPYGRLRDGTPPPDLRHGFNFRETDAARYLDYGARLYDPATGRWLSGDPQVVDGLNRYAYVRNNPVTLQDPSGQYGVSVHKWWTYGAAVLMGFRAQDAARLATETQAVDEDGPRQPLRWAGRPGWMGGDNSIHEHHFDPDRALEWFREQLVTAVVTGDMSFREAGNFLHSWEDGTYDSGPHQDGLNLGPVGHPILLFEKTLLPGVIGPWDIGNPLTSANDDPSRNPQRAQRHLLAVARMLEILARELYRDEGLVVRPDYEKLKAFTKHLAETCGTDAKCVIDGLPATDAYGNVVFSNLPDTLVPCKEGEPCGQVAP